MTKKADIETNLVTKILANPLFYESALALNRINFILFLMRDV